MFELHREYPRSEVLARLRKASHRLRKRGAFLLTDEHAACLVALERRRSPYFPDRSTFSWRAKCPDEILVERRPIDLFVAAPAQRFTYVGVASVVMNGWDGSSYFACNVRPALPRALWRGFRERTHGKPPRGGPAEAAILRLTRASGTAQRMAALRAFLKAWHGVSRAKALRKAPKRLPKPLRELYRFVGGRRNVVVFNRLESLRELGVELGHLVFYVENQGVCLWATDPSGDDPPVYFRLNEPGARWRREAEPLSGFLIQLLLFEAVVCAGCGASAANLGRAAFERLRERMQPLPLGGWLWPGVSSTNPRRGAKSHFFARDGALMFAAPNEEYFSVWLGAKDPEALSFADDLMDESWDRVAF